MTLSRKLVQPLLLLVTAFAMPIVLADSYKRINHEIDASDFERLHLEISVGEVEIEIYDGDVIELDIQLEADRRWFSLRRGNVDDVELGQRASGDTLYLEIDEDNIEQTWLARIPAALAMRIELGVGEISIEDLDNNLNLDLGVGAVRVEVTSENYHTIAATTGVGDASIRGFSDGSDNERSRFVGADAYYSGEGEYEIRVEVGVGDAQVRRR